MEIEITDQIRAAAPALHVVAVEADLGRTAGSEALHAELMAEALGVQTRYELADINRRPGIAATRRAYKALGKEPNRYRPSAEALCRRLVKGLGLYEINAPVDLINILSIRSGYSIGGFDADRIDGSLLTLGVGREGEPFEAIGRGMLNIAGMPVYRDATGGVGTPTSDNERTKLTDTTRRLLMCINIYGEEMPVDDTVALAADLLQRHCDAGNIRVTHYYAVQP